MLRKNRIEHLLIKNFIPEFLRVEDESANHHVPEGAQTHFKIIMVSTRFNNLSRIARHRLINQLLSEEFSLGLHALSMHLHTPEEWELKNESVLMSPACRDGYKNKKTVSKDGSGR